MPQIVEQLADLTALRDRDSLDTALVETLREFLQLEDIAIYRLIGPVHNQHWLTCARVQNGTNKVQSNQDGSELDELPRDSDYPHRQQALNNQKPVVATSSGICVFPLSSRSAAQGVLELGS